MGILLGLHLLAAIVWVGGMFFAYICLRPVAADVLEPPQRLVLWEGVFSRFFVCVWGAVCLLLVSGHGMIAVLGGMAAVPVHVPLMMLWGYPMVLLFGYLYFWPYLSFKSLVAEQRWPDAAKQLNRIRQIVVINLCLGLIVVLLGSSGRFLF
ncbi:CopD family protein [Amphritea sp. HPY]|uniref:CopD family protein n=1 Tax=Amphritea sp. HPY TaxID=3421652 RepID=UPI003D7E1819